jgi:hypothetical protein
VFLIRSASARHGQCDFVPSRTRAIGNRNNQTC